LNNGSVPPFAEISRESTAHATTKAESFFAVASKDWIGFDSVTAAMNATWAVGTTAVENFSSRLLLLHAPAKFEAFLMVVVLMHTMLHFANNTVKATMMVMVVVMRSAHWSTGDSQTVNHALASL